MLCRGEEQQRFKDPKEQIQDTGLPNESVPNTQPTKKCSVVTEGEHPCDSVKLPTGHVHLMESPPLHITNSFFNLLLSAFISCPLWNFLQTLELVAPYSMSPQQMGELVRHVSPYTGINTHASCHPPKQSIMFPASSIIPNNPTHTCRMNE